MPIPIKPSSLNLYIHCTKTNIREFRILTHTSAKRSFVIVLISNVQYAWAAPCKHPIRFWQMIKKYLLNEKRWERKTTVSSTFLEKEDYLEMVYPLSLNKDVSVQLIGCIFVSLCLSLSLSVSLSLCLCLYLSLSLSLSLFLSVSLCLSLSINFATAGLPYLCLSRVESLFLIELDGILALLSRFPLAF